jgi:ABC-type phosphate transport system ATPase subunit
MCFLRLQSQHAVTSSTPYDVLLLLLLQAGPEGCGKSTLLDYCFSRLPGKVTVARVHCSAQTTADNVIQKLLQVG